MTNFIETAINQINLPQMSLRMASTISVAATATFAVLTTLQTIAATPVA